MTVRTIVLTGRSLRAAFPMVLPHPAMQVVRRPLRRNLRASPETQGLSVLQVQGRGGSLQDTGS